MHVGAICTLDSLSLLLGTVYILSFLVLGMGGVLLLPLGTGGLSMLVLGLGGCLGLGRCLGLALGTGGLSLLEYSFSEPQEDCVPMFVWLSFTKAQKRC